MRNQKPEHLVIDTSVFINYTRHQKLYRLVNAIFIYNLSVYISPQLIHELEQNISETSAVELPDETYQGYLNTIKSVCIFFKPASSYTDSPDLKDNFLWDLALQTNSEVIVTKEKALLTFIDSPVIVRDIKWFKETFPVAL